MMDGLEARARDAGARAVVRVAERLFETGEDRVWLSGGDLKPLPSRGGVGGGAYPSHRDPSPAALPHPNPSPEGEGLRRSANVARGEAELRVAGETLVLTDAPRLVLTAEERAAAVAISVRQIGAHGLSPPATLPLSSLGED